MEMGLEVMASLARYLLLQCERCYSFGSIAQYVTNEPCCAHFHARVNIVLHGNLSIQDKDTSLLRTPTFNRISIL